MKFRLMGVLVLLLAALCGLSAQAALLSPETEGLVRVRAAALRPFSPATASALRTAMAGVAPVELVTAVSGVAGTLAPAAPVVGTLPPDPYASLQGVVLDVAHPRHAATGSEMSVRGADWSSGIRDAIVAGDSNASLTALLTFRSGYPEDASYLRFASLSPGRYTYVFAIQMSVADVAATKCVEFWLLTAPGANWQVLKGAQLVENTATSEIRAMFTLEVLATTPVADRKLDVMVHVNPPGVTTSAGSNRVSVTTRYAQLTRLD
jgi:hypothetical protein